MAYVNKQVFLFQITVNANHAINEAALQRYITLIENSLPDVKVTFVFVTNTELFEGGTASPRSKIFVKALKYLKQIGIEAAILHLAEGALWNGYESQMGEPLDCI